MRRCLLLQPGLVNYNTGLVLQNEARSCVEGGLYDGILVLLEHSPVITIGRGGGSENLIASPSWLQDRGIEVASSDRGGNVTCHNPGQLVGYPIFNLTRWRQDVHWYSASLEQVLINALASLGLVAGRKAKYTGVWLRDEKVAAIGLSVRRWITGHGFSLNVSNDLGLFDAIIPCGISDFGVTSLRKAGVDAHLQVVADAVTAAFETVFDCTFVEGK